jgi:hypothetical protein
MDLTTLEPYVVVSADSHVGPRLTEQLRPYCDGAHLEEFDSQAQELVELGRLLADNLALRGSVSLDRKMLRSYAQTASEHGENAVRFFRLDGDDMRAVATKIKAPTVEALSASIDEPIDRDPATLSFRAIGPWA